jgi:hypothetical protein
MPRPTRPTPSFSRPTPQSFWSYQASTPTPPAPPGFIGDWESLSPGMRREIVRTAARSVEKGEES